MGDKGDVGMEMQHIMAQLPATATNRTFLRRLLLRFNYWVSNALNSDTAGKKYYYYLDSDLDCRNRWE